ncbi:hypothetical protein ACN2ZS_003380 [Escherichia coli]
MPIGDPERRSGRERQRVYAVMMRSSRAGRCTASASVSELLAL